MTRLKRLTTAERRARRLKRDRDYQREKYARRRGFRLSSVTAPTAQPS